MNHSYAKVASSVIKLDETDQPLIEVNEYSFTMYATLRPQQTCSCRLPRRPFGPCHSKSNRPLKLKNKDKSNGRGYASLENKNGNKPKQPLAFFKN